MLLKKMSLRLLAGILALLLAGCVTVQVDLFEEPKPLKEKVVSGFARDKILLVDISGMIVESQPRSLLGLGLGSLTTPGYVKEVLDKAAKDRSIKAVVLRINSPGGTVSASAKTSSFGTRISQIARPSCDHDGAARPISDFIKSSTSILLSAPRNPRMTERRSSVALPCGALPLSSGTNRQAFVRRNAWSTSPSRRSDMNTRVEEGT